MADWGSRVAEKLPSLTSVPPCVCKEAVAIARDVGAGRIAAMDQHGIDMQVLTTATRRNWSQRAKPLSSLAPRITGLPHLCTRPEAICGLRDIISYSAKSFVATEPCKHLPGHSPA